jgi:ankyrin repeat protein
LEDIGDQNWERAHRLFQCVSVAARPLHVEELADILALDFEVESTPTFWAERRSEDPVHTVLSTCSSLLAVVDVDGSRVVQFAHFSVKEYLTSARLATAKDTITRFHVSMTPAHTIIAQACLGILLHLDENITKDRLKDFPLVDYAAEHWLDHARFENVSSNILDGMKCLFDPRKHHLSVWLWMYNPIDPEDPFSDPRVYRPIKDPLTPLHHAAVSGLCDVAKFLFVERWQDLNSQVVHWDATPLHLASEFGHAEFAQLLLEHGADTTAKDDTGFTPLCRASYEGHAEVARVILERGAEIETNHNDFNWTPLQLALNQGHAETVRVLLEHGADTEVCEDTGFTPLHLASAHERLSDARILIEHGANLEARTTSGCTPLYFANEEIARFLLQRGADARALNEDGQTPLHYASKHRCIGLARALLEYGVDAEALDADYATPLDLVPSSTDSWNREDLVELLLKYSPSHSRTGKRGSDSFHESDSGKRPRLDAVDVEVQSGGGSEDSDVLMVDGS